MRACVRSALCWPRLRPKAIGHFCNRNGRPDKSDGLDLEFDKLKKELTLAQKEISNLKNQIHQAKENIAKECAERGSKSNKDDPPDEEVGSKRFRQQAKRAKASRLGTSPPSQQMTFGRSTGETRELRLADERFGYADSSQSRNVSRLQDRLLKGF
jgi:hypothetical protein